MNRPRSQPGLGARLALAFALIAGLTALVTAIVSSYSTDRQVNAGIDDFLKERAGDIAEGRRANRENGNGRPGVPRTSQLAEIRAVVESDAEVQIVKRNGVVTLSSEVALPFEAIDEPFLERKERPLLRTVEVDGVQYRMITQHVDGAGAVQVARDLSDSQDLLSQLRSRLFIVAVAMSAIAAMLGWLVASRTTRPLRRLTASVESVAATQDLSTSIALERNDEIGRLSEEFDVLLRTLNASREQQQRLVQDAAHELRTPLTSVRANIDFLERAPDVDPTTRTSALASIRAELTELSEVLAEIVELATASAGSASFERLDLATVAEMAIAQFELRSERPVVRELDPSVVDGDLSSLVRAAANLIGNADKYSPDGLPITVMVHNGSLSVSDQGPGIAEEERERIFDRFYRSERDRSAPGSGLGLAIVAKTAEEHGGHAWARSTDTGGAHVGFTIREVSAN